MNADQIAAEAAEKIFKWYGSEPNDHTKEVIQAAIEKAIAQHHFKDRKPEVSGKFLLSRAAHASEEIWKQANIVCALSGAVANDCDHYGIKRPAWWRAVKKLQKLINPAHAIERPCTCHPSDNPPVPCQHKYALGDCLAAAAQSADTKRLIELMKHLAFSNHGFKPESCSECFNCNSVLSQTKEEE